MPSELYYPSGAASLVTDVTKTGSLATPNYVGIWTPAVGKRIVLFGFSVGARTVVANCGTSLAIGGVDFILVNTPTQTPVTINFENGLHIFGVNDVLQIDVNVAVAVTYAVWGTEI